MTEEIKELKKLWVEKHRPSKLDDYVWIDGNQNTMVDNWIKVVRQGLGKKRWPKSLSTNLKLSQQMY